MEEAVHMKKKKKLTMKMMRIMILLNRKGWSSLMLLCCPAATHSVDNTDNLIAQALFIFAVLDFCLNVFV